MAKLTERPMSEQAIVINKPVPMTPSYLQLMLIPTIMPAYDNNSHIVTGKSTTLSPCVRALSHRKDRKPRRKNWPNFYATRPPDTAVLPGVTDWSHGLEP